MGIAVWLGGCADAQMQYNVVSYDNTVADTANQSILLNAVRASQHYPMSFTSVGELAASPPVSGSLGGTFNFSNNGLTGITASPGVSASGGYTTFALNNLNFRDFMEALREPISVKIVNSFYQNTTWPREMIWLIYVQQLNLPKELVEVIDTYRKRECPPDDRKGLCGPINYNIGLYYSENCGDHFIDINKRLLDIKDPGFYYNTASNPCNFLRMKIVLEEIRLRRLDRCRTAGPWRNCVPPIFQFATFRSAQRMIEYLGELISAQLYIEHRFMPEFAFGVGKDDFREVPLFVVQRGIGPERPAVVVYHSGSFYSIPEPAFGSPTEARSLQVLDLVLQTVRAATHREDLPKIPSLGIVSAK